MIGHPSLAVLFAGAVDDVALRPFWAYLQSIAHVQLTFRPEPPPDLNPYDVIVTADTTSGGESWDHLPPYVRAGGGWLGLVHLAAEPLPPLFGAQPVPAGPLAELRVMFANDRHSLTARLPDAVYVRARHHALQPTAEDAEIMLYADWRYQHSPVLVHRAVGAGRAACTTLHAYDHPVLQQILYRVLKHLAGQGSGECTLGVGLLGYAPSVGQAHGCGVEATPGLTLRAACDLKPERLRQAGQDFPALQVYTSAEALGEAPDVDVVIIATPPNTHACLALQMMDAGKHVICEKPLALNRKETDALVAMADRQQVHLSCHQNRRWDVDYLAIKQALAEGLLGDLFYVETFVGGFEHPCGYWHSHAAISGGTAYDWGGHYLDWVVSLMPSRARAVVGTRQKRVWHDVTNADQERIQIRFAGGQEAEFMHSEIAAVRKPKWYLLGTEGAIVGYWREVTAYEIDPVLYFHQHDIPPTEMPPDLTLHRRHPSGSIVAQKLAVPKRQPYLFHRNLADHLLTGEPLVAPLDHAVQVVAILEAAARSAAHGGTVEVLDD
ncbi:MAG: Gfo/Idh/MocA family oxidoreductase [Desulfobacterales bacterium]|nr:MAG: Gfo/Idh/MocA family oxidoreductase [Desulfobacterales bacterium]